MDCLTIVHRDVVDCLTIVHSDMVDGVTIVHGDIVDRFSFLMLVHGLCIIFYFLH